MPNETHLAPPRYTIPDFFSSLLEFESILHSQAEGCLPTSLCGSYQRFPAPSGCRRKVVTYSLPSPIQLRVNLRPAPVVSERTAAWLRPSRIARAEAECGQRECCRASIQGPPLAKPRSCA